MACVAPHEDECVGSGSRETTDMSYTVTGSVEEVEGAVAEVVLGGEGADCEGEGCDFV